MVRVTPRPGAEDEPMSIGNRKPRYVSPPDFHLQSVPVNRETPQSVRQESRTENRATFGPATYYRLGVLTPGGPSRRSR